MNLSDETIRQTSLSFGKQLRELKDSGDHEGLFQKREDWYFFYSQLNQEQKTIAKSAVRVGVGQSQ